MVCAQPPPTTLNEGRDVVLCPPIPRRCWPSPLPEEVAAGLDRVLFGIRKSPQAIPPPPPRNLTREPACYPFSAGGTRSGPGGLLGGGARHRHVPSSFPSPRPLPPLPFLFSVPLDSSPESPKPRGASRLACPLALPRPLWTGMVLPRLPPPHPAPCPGRMSCGCSGPSPHCIGHQGVGRGAPRPELRGHSSLPPQAQDVLCHLWWVA